MGILIGDILPTLHKNFQGSLKDDESKGKLKFDDGKLGEMGKWKKNWAKNCSKNCQAF